VKNNEGNMKHINRLIYAFFLTIVAVGIMTLIIMVFSLDVGETVFSEVFFVPVFIISYLVAPLLNKHIKLE
jgi:hypothetical protein